MGDYMAVNWSKTTDDYAEYRLGFPGSLYDRIDSDIVKLAGLRALDLGTGTGTVAREMAARNAVMTGVDIDSGMIDKARELDPAIEWLVSSTESIDLPAGVFDLIVAGQCWHWFDRAATSAECWRLLKDGGVLMIMHYDWIPVEGNIVSATEELIKHHSPKWKGHGGIGVYPWYRDLDSMGFDSILSFTYDEPAEYSHVAWRGRIRASAGVGGTLSDDEVVLFDNELAELLLKNEADDPMIVPHRVFCVAGTKNGGNRPNKAVNWTP
jgi:SAM-dependent methyltransferase